jgi:hypothetical protein
MKASSSPSLLVHWGKTLNISRLLIAVCFLATLGRFSAHAQDLVSLDRAYYPDEPIHIIMTFAGRVDLSNAGVEFDLVKLDNQAQSQWTRAFTLGQLKPLKPTEYEASGAIPAYSASGTYRVTRAWSGVSDLSKTYNYPDTLHQDITIRVINENPDPIPPLIDLKLVK